MKLLKKERNYLAFSTVSILVGISYFAPSINISEWVYVLTSLPVLYISVLIARAALANTQKILISSIDAGIIEAKKRNIVSASQAIGLTIFTIVNYYLFSFIIPSFISFLTKMSVSVNSRAVMLLLMYSIFMWIRRDLRKAKSAPSYLKLGDYRRSHIFAATCIGFPFLYGIFFTNKRLPSSDIIDFYVLSFSFYILAAWAVLYQYRAKKNLFLLKPKIYWVQSLAYPLFPLIFYYFYYRNFDLVVVSYFLTSLIFVTPFLYVLNHRKSLLSSIIRGFANEKVYLLVLLLSLFISRHYFNDFEIPYVKSVVLFFSANIAETSKIYSEILILLLGQIIFIYQNQKTKDRSNEDIKTILYYLISPLLVATSALLILFILHNMQNYLPPNNPFIHSLILEYILGLVKIYTIIATIFMAIASIKKEILINMIENIRNK
ncbi:MAG: hypothetical protein C0609_06185 [Deltaproteobacteria bacterium]|nr:MAG: hypothetical protein C0609_06185 [Deltaproteobacteria bacterium]